MSRVSRHLLNNPTLPNPSHDEFLLGSALLADLLLNQSQEAAQIWQRYHPQYQLNPQSSLLLRLLAAHNGLI